jgi:hypothetical protein
MIRNIMIHNDGVATDYHKALCKKEKKTEFEKRLIKAIERTEGVEVNLFNGIIVDEGSIRFFVFGLVGACRKAGRCFTSSVW